MYPTAVSVGGIQVNKDYDEFKARIVCISKTRAKMFKPAANFHFLINENNNVIKKVYFICLNTLSYH